MCLASLFSLSSAACGEPAISLVCSDAACMSRCTYVLLAALFRHYGICHDVQLGSFDLWCMNVSHGFLLGQVWNVWSHGLETIHIFSPYFLAV